MTMAILERSIDLTSESVRQDPFPAYEKVRRHGPVYVDPTSGKKYFGRYAEVREILTDADTFSSKVSGVERTFMGADEDLASVRIKAIRAMVRAALSTKKVGALEGFISSAADHAVRSALCQPVFECRSALSAVVPAGAIGMMFGIEGDNTERFMRWTEAVLLLGRKARRANPTQPGLGLLTRLRTMRRTLMPTRMEANLSECIAFMREHFTQRKSQYVDAWVAESMLTYAEANELDAEGMIDIALGFMVAAAESTTSLVTSSVLILARKPELQEYIRTGDHATTLFVDEVLRYESPVQRRQRAVRSDCEVSGVPMKRGEIVTLLIGSANRDLEVFAHADRFDHERNPNPHLAFGMGPRSCPGSQLGRLEVCAVLKALVQQAKRLELARPSEPLRYPSYISLRGPRELYVQSAAE
jgi:cytochrome P450